MGEITRAEYDMLMSYLDSSLEWKQTDEQLRYTLASITQNKLTAGELMDLISGDTSYVEKPEAVWRGD